MTRYIATVEFVPGASAAIVTVIEDGGTWSESYRVVGTTGHKADVYAEANSLAAATATERGGYLESITVVPPDRAVAIPPSQ